MLAVSLLFISFRITLVGLGIIRLTIQVQLPVFNKSDENYFKLERIEVTVWYGIGRPKDKTGFKSDLCYLPPL